MCCGRGGPYVCERGSYPCRFAEVVVAKVASGVCQNTDMPDFYYAQFPMQDDKGNEMMVDVPFLLPHEVLARIIADKNVP